MCQGGLSRGAFLKTVVGAGAAAALPGAARATGVTLHPRELWIVDAHSGRELRAFLTIDGTHLWRGTRGYPGYNDLCWLLRDEHKNIEAPISVMLFEVVWETQMTLRAWGHDKPIVSTSAYRTTETNSAVGGARYSYHERAGAIDFVVPDTPLEVVWSAAASRAYTGGLGFYSDHIHADIGPRRYWQG